MSQIFEPTIEKILRLVEKQIEDSHRIIANEDQPHYTPQIKVLRKPPFMSRRKSLTYRLPENYLSRRVWREPTLGAFIEQEIYT